MAAGIVTNLRGASKFYVKDVRGNIRELKVGDEVSENSIITADASSKNSQIVVELNNTDIVVLNAKQGQLIDSSVNTKNFGNEEVAFNKKPVDDTTSNQKDVTAVETAAGEDPTNTKTDAGEETEARSERVVARFDVRDGAIINIATDLDSIALNKDVTYFQYEQLDSEFFETELPLEPTPELGMATVSLMAATNFLEEGGSITLRAVVDTPMLSDLVFNLSNGETILIPAGQTQGSVTYLTREDDAYNQGDETETISIINTEGGEERELNTDSETTVTVTDGKTTTTVTLTTDKTKVDEGDSVVITAKVDNPPEEDLKIELSNGQTIIIPKGETQGSVTYVTAKDEVYQEEPVQETISITNTEGGNFEDLNTDSKANIIVSDGRTKTTVTLTATEATEGENITITANVDNAPSSDLIINLSNGKQITIKAGEKEGSVTYLAREDDAYRQENTEDIVYIKDTTGGNYEYLDIHNVGAVADIIIKDDKDTTTIKLGMPEGGLTEGETSLITVTVSNPAQTDLKLYIKDSQGETHEVTIKAGGTTGTFEFTPKESAYNKEVTFTVTNNTGGNYEDLSKDLGTTGGPHKVNPSTDDSTKITIEVTDKDGNSNIDESDEEITVTVKVDTPPKTDLIVTVDDGKGGTVDITIPAGETEGSKDIDNPFYGEDKIKDGGSFDVGIKDTEGGDYDNLDTSDKVTVTVDDTIDTTIVTLDVPQLTEGEVTTINVKIDNVLANDFILTIKDSLGNNHIVTIKAGETQSSFEFTPNNDIYKTNETVSFEVINTNNENVDSSDISKSSYNVANIDTQTTITLTTHESITETDKFITITATVENTPKTDLIITLDNGQIITIKAGETSANVIFDNPYYGEDIYKDETNYEVKISNTTGGDYEKLDISSKVMINIKDIEENTTTVDMNVVVDETNETATATIQTSNIPDLSKYDFINTFPTVTIKINGVEQTLNLDKNGKAIYTFSIIEDVNIKVTDINGNFEAVDLGDTSWTYKAPEIETPISSNDNISLNEDTTYTLKLSDFGDTQENIAKIKITELPENGKIYFNGVEIGIGFEFTVENLEAKLVTFKPNYNSDEDSKFGFVVGNKNDEFNDTKYTTTITVDAVADTPTLEVDLTDKGYTTIIINPENPNLSIPVIPSQSIPLEPLPISISMLPIDINNKVIISFEPLKPLLLLEPSSTSGQVESNPSYDEKIILGAQSDTLISSSSIYDGIIKNTMDTVISNSYIANGIIIDVGEGNNEISISNFLDNNSSIIAGSGNDTVIIGGSVYSSNIDIGEGSNTVSINGGLYNSSIKTGFGDDTVIVGIVESSNIDVGLGDNIIGAVSLDSSTITTEMGDDDITIVSDIIKSNINLGHGNNVIKIGGTLGTSSSITTGEGDDIAIINTVNNNASINLGTGNNKVQIDSLFNGANINLENGNNTLGDNTVIVKYMVGSDSSITTGIGNDTLIFGTNVLGKIDVGDGYNTVSIEEGLGIFGVNASIISGVESDMIIIGGTVYSSNINAGEGHNIISLGAGTFTDNSSITAGNGNDTVIIGYNLLDIIEDTNENEVPNIGFVDTSSINVGDGNNTISINSNTIHSLTIKSGIGDDKLTIGTNLVFGSVFGNSIDLGDGNNTISIGNNIDFDYSTITVEGGNDTVIIGYSNSLGGNPHDNNINVGDGNNLVSINDEILSFTITAGNGNDDIIIGGTTTSSNISVGDGNNTVSIHGDFDLLSTITTGTGDDKVIIEGKVSNMSNINLSDGNNTVSISDDFNSMLSAITTGFGDDKIIIGGSVYFYSSINLGDGNNIVNIGGDLNDVSKIISGVGDDRVIINGDMMNSTISTDIGNDIVNIYKNTTYANISVGAGNDIISINGSIQSATIDGGEGLDTLSIKGSQVDYTVKNAQGKFITWEQFFTENGVGDTNQNYTVTSISTNYSFTVTNLENIVFEDDIQTLPVYNYELSFKAGLTDTDGSETLSNITLSNVPQDTVLKDINGKEVLTNEDGTYTVVVDANGEAKITLESANEISNERLNDITASVTATETSNQDTQNTQTNVVVEQDIAELSTPLSVGIDFSNLDTQIEDGKLDLQTESYDNIMLSLGDLISQNEGQNIDLNSEELDSITSKDTLNENTAQNNWSNTEASSNSNDVYLSSDSTLEIKVEQQISDGITH